MIRVPQIQVFGRVGQMIVLMFQAESSVDDPCIHPFNMNMFLIVLFATAP